MKINPKGMEKRDENGPQHRMARQRLVFLGCKCRVSFLPSISLNPTNLFSLSRMLGIFTCRRLGCSQSRASQNLVSLRWTPSFFLPHSCCLQLNLIRRSHSFVCHLSSLPSPLQTTTAWPWHDDDAFCRGASCSWRRVLAWRR